MEVKREEMNPPICPDCHIPAEKFITTAAALYGIPQEDWVLWPGCTQPRWDGEWVCPKCHHLVAITDLKTGELYNKV